MRSAPPAEMERERESKLTQTEPKPLICFILFHVLYLHTNNALYRIESVVRKKVDLKQKAGVTDLIMLLWYVLEALRFIFKTIAGIEGTLSFQKTKEMKGSR